MALSIMAVGMFTACDGNNTPSAADVMKGVTYDFSKPVTVTSTVKLEMGQQKIETAFTMLADLSDSNNVKIDMDMTGMPIGSNMYVRGYEKSAALYIVSEENAVKYVIDEEMLAGLTGSMLPKPSMEEDEEDEPWDVPGMPEPPYDVPESSYMDMITGMLEQLSEEDITKIADMIVAAADHYGKNVLNKYGKVAAENGGYMVSIDLMKYLRDTLGDVKKVVNALSETSTFGDLFNNNTVKNTFDFMLGGVKVYELREIIVKILPAEMAAMVPEATQNDTVYTYLANVLNTEIAEGMTLADMPLGLTAEVKSSVVSAVDGILADSKDAKILVKIFVKNDKFAGFGAYIDPRVESFGIIDVFFGIEETPDATFVNVDELNAVEGNVEDLLGGIVM